MFEYPAVVLPAGRQDCGVENTRRVLFGRWAKPIPKREPESVCQIPRPFALRTTRELSERSSTLFMGIGHAVVLLSKTT